MTGDVSSEHVYRTIWRWHFYAGVFTAPILLWAAVTGALYIFVDEIDLWLSKSLLIVEPATAALDLTEQFRAVQQQFPDEPLRYVNIFGKSDRTTEFTLKTSDSRSRCVYVNPYHGEVVGERFSDSGFFPTVRMLHRTIYAGTFGRMLMELATSWGILLLASGLFLWWPRRTGKSARGGGVWWIRFSKGTKALLRDLHAVLSIYLLPVSLIILLTGLFYTQVWGRGYLVTMVVSGQAPEALFDPPHSIRTDAEQPLNLQEIYEISKKTAGRFPIGIEPPHDSDGAYQVSVGTSDAPMSRAVYAIDQYSGTILAHTDAGNASAMLIMLSYAYPLHVGSIGGIVTKCLALIACLILILTVVTGLWMWWRMRPAGKLGLPSRASSTRLGLWPIAAVCLCGIVFPMVGASLMIVCLFDWLWVRCSTRG